MDIQTLLEYLHKTGGPDGVKAVAFAKVDHANPDECKAGMAIFGALWAGINVLQANMQEFNAEQPFDYVARSAVDGGHSVLTGGYGAPGAGALGGDVRFITWAEESSFTDAYWQHEVEECWVVIWPEHLGTQAFLQGIDQAQLASAYQQITGQPFPVVPQPTPPAPPAPPAPTPPAPDIHTDVADDALAAAVLAWSEGHHTGANARAAHAVRKWAAAKGLMP